MKCSAHVRPTTKAASAMRSPFATARHASPSAIGRSQMPHNIDHMPVPDQTKLLHSMP